MKTRLLLSGILAAFLAASPTLAQTVYLHGGAGFPNSTFNDVHNAGFNTGIGVGIPLTSQFELLLRGSYDRFGTNVAATKPYTSYSALAFLKWNVLSTSFRLRPSSRLRPYAVLGGGNFVEVEGPFEFALGLSAGAGMAIRTSSRTHFTIEPAYVVVLNDGANREAGSVRLGVAARLR